MAWVIVGIVVASLGAIVLMAGRRKWNADGSDDVRRTRKDPMGQEEET
jgi:hypothetical protein